MLLWLQILLISMTSECLENIKLNMINSQEIEKDNIDCKESGLNKAAIQTC